QRDVFVRYFGILVVRFRIAQHTPPMSGSTNRNAPPSPTPRAVTALPGEDYAVKDLELLLYPDGGKRDRLPPVIAPTFDWLAAFPDEKRILVYPPSGGKPVATLVQKERIMSDWMAPAVSFSPDGKRLAVATGDRRIRIWDWKAGKIVAETPKRENAFDIWT